MRRWEWLHFYGLSQPRRFHILHAWRTLISDDVFVLRFAAEGRINIREGPQRTTLMLLICRDPGLKPSCHVRNNNEWNGRVAAGPNDLYSRSIWSWEDRPSQGGSEAAAALKTWMFIVLGWRGILCNYDALFTLEAILSAPMITVCAVSTNTRVQIWAVSVDLFMSPAS